MRLGGKLALFVLLLGVDASALTKAERDLEHGTREAAFKLELEHIAPEAVRPFEEANKAYFGDHSDLHAVEQGYAKVLELAPSFTPALRRHGTVLAQLGRHNEGIAEARKAVALVASTDNQCALAMTLVEHADGQIVPSADVQEAKTIIGTVLQRAPDDYFVVLTDCRIAISGNDLEELKSCSKRAVAMSPDDPQAHALAAMAAAASGDTDGVHDSIAKGRAVGLDPKVADDLDDFADESQPWWARWGPRALKLLVGWLAGLALLLGIGAVLSRATLNLAGQLAHEEGRARAATLRSVYRFVLHLTCLYYYLSIPVVLAVCVVAGGGVIAGFFMLGTIPIKLVLIIVLVVGYTVVAVARSILFRPKEQDPGTLLPLDEHPKLKATLEEVAKRVDTRVVDNVYITPNVSVAVLERGGLSKQLRGRTERCLVVGIATLDGMKEAPFKAILAHEYGHFSNRDTAGGGFALAVRRSLLFTMIGLASGGAATWYNPAWWFVVGFQKLFLRVSQGASRLQEVMADRWAAVAYGPEAFARGLAHVVRRSIEFEAHTQTTLSEVIKLDRPLKNLYVYDPRKPVDAEDIEEAVETSMTREPSEYDSHPRPVDRIAWVRELATSMPSEGDADAWDLFEDKVKLQRAMTDEIRAAVERNHGVVIAARKKKRAPDEEKAPD